MVDHDHGHAAGGAGPAQSIAGFADELPDKAVDTVDLVVAFVHNKAVRPLVVATRAIVFGILIAVLATVVLLLVSIAVLRLLDVYAFPGRIWASYAVLGAVFTLGGLLTWSRRSKGARTAVTD